MPYEPWDDSDEAIDATLAEMSNTSQEVSQPTSVVEPEVNDELSTLEQEVGVKLSELGSEPEAPTDTPEVTKVDYSEFDKQFTSRFGIEPEEAIALVNELRTFQTRSLIQEQERKLASEWGGEFEQRFNAVKEYFKTLPPAQQQALDNINGAKLIWAKISSDMSSTKPNVPTYVSGSTTMNGSNQSYKFKYSDIIAMPQSEYARKQAEINEAYASGKVLFDMDDVNF